jgi:hypothetical protein
MGSARQVGLFLFGVFLGSSGYPRVEPPFALHPPASSAARVREAVEPKALRPVLGATSYEGTAAPEEPLWFSLTLPASWRTTIGISSRSGKARITLYPANKLRPLPGTERETGCIRWIGQPSPGVPLLIEVHTAGEPTPIRLDLLLEETPPEAP